MNDPASARRRFVVDHTAPQSPSLIPELRLYTGSAVTPLWELTAPLMADRGLPPPYWAFAWPGGQAIARYILDHPADFRGKSLLDFAAGGGVVALAAARVGMRVTAVDIDPFAVEALRLNAALNGADLDIREGDLVESDEGWDVISAGDVCYESETSRRIVDWLRRLAGRGANVLLGDPGRSYLPAEGLQTLTTFDVPTTVELEDAPVRRTTVFRVDPAVGGWT